MERRNPAVVTQMEDVMVQQQSFGQTQEAAESIRSAQKAVRATIAEAMRRHALSRSQLAAAVEAELLVQGFDVRVMPLESSIEQRLPLAV
jgi:hypothetical protein